MYINENININTNPRFHVLCFDSSSFQGSEMKSPTPHHKCMQCRTLPSHFIWYFHSGFTHTFINDYIVTLFVLVTTMYESVEWLKLSHNLLCYSKDELEIVYITYLWSTWVLKFSTWCCLNNKLLDDCSTPCYVQHTFHL